MYKIYRYSFPDGKIYIGVTKNTVQYRKDCGYQHNKPLTEAIRSIGFKNVAIDILYETEDKTLAFEEEKRLIAQYNACDPKYGYNVSYGGKNTFEGLKHSEQHKQKMSRLYKGKTWSEEEIQHMRYGHRKERHPVCSLDDDMKIVKRYLSLGDAALDVGGYKSNITKACRSYGKKYKGFYWKLDNGGDVG